MSWALSFVALIGVGLIFFVLTRNEKTITPTQDTLLHNNNSAPMQPSIPGLTTEILTKGTGEAVKKGQTIVVDYTGKLIDGTVFDSSIPRGTPFTLHLGAGEVIPGWDLGIVGMQVGEERRLTILPALAYGPDGISGVIPPNATLVFDVTLRAIR
jgi:FKBP-type peptidyl-prolyl cis-trans isomerase